MKHKKIELDSTNIEQLRMLVSFSSILHLLKINTACEFGAGCHDEITGSFCSECECHHDFCGCRYHLDYEPDRDDDDQIQYTNPRPEGED